MGQIWDLNWHPKIRWKLIYFEKYRVNKLCIKKKHGILYNLMKWRIFYSIKLQQPFNNWTLSLIAWSWMIKKKFFILVRNEFVLMRVKHAGSYFRAKEPHGRKQLLTSSKYLCVGWLRFPCSRRKTHSKKHFILKSSTSIVQTLHTWKIKGLIKICSLVGKLDIMVSAIVLKLHGYACIKLFITQSICAVTQ